MDDYLNYQDVDSSISWMVGPWLYWLIGFYLCLPITAYVVLPYFRSKSVYSGTRKSITIIVLGDLGHSPRICYQAKSFSNFDYYVSLCGYLETEPPLEVIDDINIDITEIKAIKNSFNLPYVLFALQKVWLQGFQLFTLLISFRGTDYMLLQNPPSIPILLLMVIFKKIFSPSTFLIVDWHNLNYSILNLKFKNENHPIVRAAKFYEQFLGKRYVDLNITVTKSMKRFLAKEFGFESRKIVTLYDRPSSMFQPVSSSEEKEKIISSIDVFDDIPNIHAYKILISSTSFTPDEDFNVLLQALKSYESQIDTTTDLPPILLIVTGKGPLKDQFLTAVKQLDFNAKKIIIRSAWLAIEDYPKVLSVADLSVSLHTSSSGIDLPMKIVDFFGCGIPVITLKFPAIGELVKDGVNGLITSDKPKVNSSDEIYRLLYEVFTNDKLLSTLKEGALQESELRWDENWSNTLGNFFEY